MANIKVQFGLQTMQLRHLDRCPFITGFTIIDYLCSATQIIHGYNLGKKNNYFKTYFWLPHKLNKILIYMYLPC